MLALKSIRLQQKTLEKGHPNPSIVAPVFLVLPNLARQSLALGLTRGHDAFGDTLVVIAHTRIALQEVVQIPFLRLQRVH